MSVIFLMEDGTEVIVPPDVLTQGDAAVQSFYDNQVRRVRMEHDDARRPAKRKDVDA